MRLRICASLGLLLIVIFHLHTAVVFAEEESSLSLKNETELYSWNQNGAELTLSYYQPKDNPDSANSSAYYGIDYELDMEPFNTTESYSSNTWLRRLGISGEGTFAFDQSANRNDYNNVEIDLRFEGSVNVGKKTDRTADIQDAISACMENPDDCNPDEMAANPDTLNLFRFSKDVHHFELAPKLAYEFTQDFNQANMVFGLEAGYSSFLGRDTNTLARLLDYPFGLVRTLLDGSSDVPYLELPTIRLAIEQVKPDGDIAREALGLDETYDRAMTEISFSRPIGRIRGRSLIFDWNYRYFKELSPDALVRTANLDRFISNAYSVTYDGNLVFTYRDGRLPFDQVTDEVFELGFIFHGFKLDRETEIAADK